MITTISATSPITISTAPTTNGRVASICRNASASSTSLNGGASCRSGGKLPPRNSDWMTFTKNSAT